MSILKTDWLVDTTTLWVRSGFNSFGHSTYDNPVSVSARWENKEQLVEDIEGNQKMSKASLYLNRDVAVGDFFYLGTSANANPIAGAYEVIKFIKTPSVSGSNYERIAILG